MFSPRLSKYKKSDFYISTAFLSFGVFLYLFAYPYKFQEINILWIWTFEPYKISVKNIFLPTIYSLTSYCHVIFIIFFSFFLTKVTYLSIYVWSGFWGFMDSIFEILQRKNQEIIEIEYGFLKYIDNYFVYGNFDILDISAIWLGVATCIFYKNIEMLIISRDN